METFKVEIKETLKRVVEVEAEDFLDASAKVNEMYDNEEEVLDYEDLYSTDINISEEDESLNQLLVDNSDAILKAAENMFGEMSLQELAILAFGSLNFAVMEFK